MTHTIDSKAFDDGMANRLGRDGVIMDGLVDAVCWLICVVGVYDVGDGMDGDGGAGDDDDDNDGVDVDGLRLVERGVDTIGDLDSSLFVGNDCDGNRSTDGMTMDVVARAR